MDIETGECLLELKRKLFEVRYFFFLFANKYLVLSTC